MVVAGVDHLAGHQVRHEQMPRACLALGVEVEDLLPARAGPAALDRRRMQAGPAGDRGCRLAMAEVVVVAEPALEPARVLGDARRRPGGADDAGGLGEQPLGRVGVGADALDMQVVGVLADREVHRAGQPGQVHVDLHLRPVLRLGFGDALGDKLAEALQRVGLELQHVPGLRRLEEPERHAVERAAEVAAVRLDAPLPPGLGIDLEHRRADAAQVLHDPRLLELPGLEEPQHPAREARRRRPAEGVPERALAGPADLRSAEVRAEAGIGVRLVGGEDRLAGRRGRRRQLRHQTASPPGA